MQIDLFRKNLFMVNLSGARRDGACPAVATVAYSTRCAQAKTVNLRRRARQTLSILSQLLCIMTVLCVAPTAFAQVIVPGPGISAGSVEQAVKSVEDDIRMQNDIGVFYGQCPTSQNKECGASLRQAWHVCQNQIHPKPSGGGAPFAPDPAKVVEVAIQCQSSYPALIKAYAKFSGNAKSVANLSSSCPNEQASGQSFTAAREQCAKDKKVAQENCTGGLPQITDAFYSTGKTTQTPAGLDDCTGEINAFKGKWGIYEPIISKLNDASSTATVACMDSGLPACSQAVSTKVEECKAKIDKQVNAVWIIPGAPGFKAELAKATKDLDWIGNGCVQSVLKAPEQYLKNNAAEALAMQIYGNQCPQDTAKMSNSQQCIIDPSKTNQCPPNTAAANFVQQQCKAELLKTMETCVSPGGSAPVSRSNNAQALQAPGAAGASSSPATATTVSDSSVGAKNSAMTGQVKNPKIGMINLPEQQVENCKPKLQAVIDKYKPAKLAAPSRPEPNQTSGTLKSGALPGVLTASSQPKAGGATPGIATSGTPADASSTLAPGVVKPSAAPAPVVPATPAVAPAKLARPDPFLYTLQRKPLLEAPWLTQCVSNGCRTEVSRLVADRIRDELDAMGTRVNPAEPRAVDTLYRDLDMKYRAPLDMALKKRV